MTKAFKSQVAKATLGLIAGLTMMLGASSASALTMAEAQTLISILGLTGAQAQAVLALAGGSTTSTGSTSGYQFNANLTVGSTGNDVKELQKFLNSDPATALAVTAGSAGSPGNESMYFGPATRTAVAKYQTKHGISPAAGYFGPLTRASVNASTGSTGNTGNTGNTGSTGPVSAMVSSTNPSAGNVIKGQATADFLHVTFTGNGTVTGMSLQRKGISVSTDLTAVYLYDGATRLTDSATVNNSGVVTFNGLNIAVNGSRTVAVKADLSSSATAGTIGLDLTGFTANGSTTSTTLMGNLMSVVVAPSNMAGVDMCTGGCSATGATNNQIGNTTISAGVQNQTVWQAPIQVSNQEVALKGMTLRFVGSAPYDSLTNVKLMVDGLQVGSTTTVNSNGYLVFDMTSSPKMISTGSHTFEVRADIVKGSARTFQISLQNAADLMMMDTQLNVNVAPTSNTSTFSQSQAGTFTVSAGSVTVSIHPDFNAVTNVTGGSTNTVIAKYKLRGYGEDVKVQSLQVTPYFTSPTLASGSCAGTSTCSLNNVALFFNGSQVGSSQDLVQSSATTLTFQLGSSMIVPAGQDSVLEVRADLQNASSVNYTGGTIYNTLVLGSNNGQGLSSLDSTIDVPSAAVTTSGLTIQTGTLAVATNPSFVSQTMNPNTTGAKIGSYILQNQSTSESVRITNLAVGLTFSTAASTNYGNLKVTKYNGAPVQPQTSNSFSVDFTIAPNATEVIDVWADLGTASAGSIVSTMQVTAIGSSSNVTVCSSSLSSGSTDGCDSGTAKTGQTITLGSGTFGTPSFVTSGSTLSQYVSGGTDPNSSVKGQTKAIFKFTATNGNATITELRFKNTGTSGAITKVKVGSNEGTTVSDIANLTGLNIAVPQGGAGATIDVFSEYAAVGPLGLTTTTTGDITANLKLCYVKYSIGGTVGTAGSTTCASSGSYPIDSAQTMVLVGAAPTVTTSQPSNVVLTTGAVEAINVTITAPAAGPITINSFPITSSLSASSGSPTFSTGTSNPFTVKDGNNNTISVANTSNFSSTAGGSATVTFSSPYLINANSSVTFKVFLPVATLGTGTLPNTNMYTSLATGSGFSWTDTAGNATNASTGTTYIYNYPSTKTYTIHN